MFLMFTVTINQKTKKEVKGFEKVQYVTHDCRDRKGILCSDLEFIDTYYKDIRYPDNHCMVLYSSWHNLYF